MTQGLYSAPSIAAVSVPTPPSPLFTLFYDASNSNIPSIKAHTTGTVVGLGGLTQEQIEDFIGTTLLTASTEITWTYNDGAGTITGALIAGSVANSKLANMAAGTVKANTTGGATAPVDTAISTTFKTALGLVKGDVGLGNVDNTSDASKPVSTATQTALNLKADLAGPTFTGDPKAPTPSPGDNDTSIATTAFVTAADTAAISAAIIDSIADADTTHAPSRNAVFDALALKLNSSAVGTVAAKNVGNTVLDPGTGKLEHAVPSLGLITGTNRTYTALERGYIARRSNAGAVMSDTLPLLANTTADIGYTITIYNEDTVLAAVLTMNASGGALFRSATGGTSATSPLNYGTRQQFVWDGTAWILTAGNANIVRRSGAIVAGNAPKFLDSAGNLVIDSGFPAAAATASAPGFQSAADKARQDNNALGWVNILDYGGDRTGVASSATALTNAQAALPSGGIIFFPAGTYQFGNVNYNLSTAHITLKGAARYNTVFTTTSTSTPIITRNQYYQTVEDITFTGTGSAQNPTGTAGQTLLACNAANSAYGSIRRVTCTYGHTMIDISDTLSVVEDVECRFFKADGVLVNQNSDHKIENATMDNNSGILPTGGGIHVKLTASLLMNSNNIIHSNKALWIDAATGVTIPSVKGVNNFLDNSAYGLCCDGDGSFLRSEFTNTWFSSMATAGVALTPTAGGQADGITLVNCDIYNNVAGTTNGILTNAQTKKWKAIGCSIAGWTTGINLVAGASHFPTITANTIGSVSAFGVNTTGIAIGAGAYGGLIIQGNDVIDNTTAATFGAVTITSAVYTRYRITDNAGINPKGAVTTPAVAATGVAVTNTTGFRVIIGYKTTGTIHTAFNINGVAFAAPNLQPITSLSYITLEPGGTVTWTGGTAPTWVWVGQ